MSDLTLPKDTEEVACFPDFSSYHMTLERDKDRNVYLVSWAYHHPTILAVIKPDGIVLNDKGEVVTPEASQATPVTVICKYKPLQTLTVYKLSDGRSIALEDMVVGEHANEVLRGYGVHVPEPATLEEGNTDG